MPPRKGAVSKSKSNENNYNNGMSPYFALLASHKQKIPSGHDNFPNKTYGDIDLKRRKITKNEPPKNLEQEFERELINDVITISDDTPITPVLVKSEDSSMKVKHIETKFEESPIKCKKTQSFIVEEFERDTNDENNGDEENDEDSDIDWEDVLVDDLVVTPLPQSQQEPLLPHLDLESKKESLVIQLGNSKKENQRSNKKKRGSGTPGLTKLDRQQRLTIHKLHLLCLLSHIKIRNHWISNTQVRLKLRNLLSENTRKLLHPENTVIVKGDSREFLSPILRTRKFLDGLKAAMEYWAKKFRINKRGIHLRHWNEFYEKITFSDYDINITEDKFFAKITRSFNGSRDIAAQGFCALLRSVDVNARIVSSLQVVDYTSRDPWAERPANTTPQLPREALPENKVEECLSTFKLSPKKPLTSSKRIRFKNGAPTRAMTPAPHHPQFLDSAYPVYWVEAYDCASQRWVSIDPCSKKIVEVVKYRSKLEPPLNDPKNTLSYVVAFDDQGFARDVTRRYTQFYNTKTRKKRVTNLGPQGKEWWEEKVMKACFEPKFQSDIDQLEVAELNNREIQEKLPTNIQDFKNHPIFVLERHLKQSEVLMEPRIPCGTLAVTSGRRVEKIFKRKDVRAVKSALTWYQLGKIIKPGQQPLKMVKRKKFTRKRSSLDDAFDEPSELEDNLETGLYSIEQTELYVPPPVENGIVPKNPFGNLDVYVPTMIPKGGIHLLSSKFPRVVRAAQELEIDYAPAVVGFDFGGSSTGESRGARVANPKIDGIIVPVEHAVSVVIICKELDKVALKEEKEMREAQALGKWRRYFSAIAIKRRLDRLHGKINETGEDDRTPENRRSGSDEKYWASNEDIKVAVNSDEDPYFEKNEKFSQIDNSWVKTHFFNLFKNIQNDIDTGKYMVKDLGENYDDQGVINDESLEGTDFEETSYGDGGFMIDERDVNEGGEFVMNGDNGGESGFMTNEDEYEGGGFMCEDDMVEKDSFEDNKRENTYIRKVENIETFGELSKENDLSDSEYIEIIDDNVKNGEPLNQVKPEISDLNEVTKEDSGLKITNRGIGNLEFSKNEEDNENRFMFDCEGDGSETDDSEPVCISFSKKAHAPIMEDKNEIEHQVTNKPNDHLKHPPKKFIKEDIDEKSNDQKSSYIENKSLLTPQNLVDTPINANLELAVTGSENKQNELEVGQDSEGDFFPDSMSESELLGSDYE